MPCNDSEEDMNVGLPPPRSDRAKMAGNPGPAQPDSDPEVTDAQLEKCLEEQKRKEWRAEEMERERRVHVYQALGDWRRSYAG